MWWFYGFTYTLGTISKPYHYICLCFHLYLFLNTAEFAESIFSGWFFFSAPFGVMLPGQHQHSKRCTDASPREVLLLKPPFQWQLHVRKRELWWCCKLVLLPIAVANMCLEKFSSDVWWIGQDVSFVLQVQRRRVSCNWHSSQASRSDTSTLPVGFQYCGVNLLSTLGQRKCACFCYFSGSGFASFFLYSEVDVAPFMHCVYSEICKGFLRKDVL